ncbi:MAG: FAD-dependent oxidoreductase [Candidatus Norongarragalinales archaeon]
MAKLYDLIIIGGGIVGLASAMYAGRLNLKTLVIAGTRYGTIALTDVVENYPGFKRLTGLELAQKMEEHALDYSKFVEIIDEKAEKVEACGNSWLVYADGKKYNSKTVLFATGTEIRKLGVPGEKEYWNRGVHSCALCDGPIYQDKTVAVVGGGDSAAKEALLLTQFAKRVVIFVRGEELKPEPINGERVKKNKKITVATKMRIVEVKGDGKKITKLVLDKPFEGKKEFATDALFLEIGHIPLSALAKEIGVKTNDRGEIVINRDSETNVAGVFAAGDVGDTRFKQAITGVGEGVLAVYSAYKYINETEIFPCNEA